MSSANWWIFSCLHILICYSPVIPLAFSDTHISFCYNYVMPIGIEEMQRCKRQIFSENKPNHFSGSASNFSIKSVESTLNSVSPAGADLQSVPCPACAKNLLLFQSKVRLVPNCLEITNLRQRGIFIKSQIISFIEIILPYSLSL